MAIVGDPAALVPVYVPTGLLPELHEWLAARWTQVNSSDVAPPTEEDTRMAEWTIERLRHALEARGPVFRWFVQYLGAAPGKCRSFDELVHAYADDSNDPHANGRLKGVLSGLTKYGKKHGLTTWPFEWRMDPSSGHYSYVMTPQMAQRIRALTEHQ